MYYKEGDSHSILNLMLVIIVIQNFAVHTLGQEQCFNLAGGKVGAKGNQNIRPQNTFVGGTIFERKNGDQCPCSYVSHRH